MNKCLAVADIHEQAFHIPGGFLGQEGEAGAVDEAFFIGIGDGIVDRLGINEFLGGGVLIHNKKKKEN